jgi:hypothetical protein
MPRRGRVVGVMAAVAAMLGAGQVVGATGLKSPWVRVSRGQIANESWFVGMRARQGHRCYRQWLKGINSEVGAKFCRSGRRPPAPWNSLGGVGDRNASTHLYETQRRVHSVKLRIEHRDSHEKYWARFATDRLSLAQARQTHLKRNFRFLVLTAHRFGICVRKVVMFDGSSARIGRLTRSPCGSRSG